MLTVTKEITDKTAWKYLLKNTEAGAGMSLSEALDLIPNTNCIDTKWLLSGL